MIIYSNILIKLIKMKLLEFSKLIDDIFFWMNRGIRVALWGFGHMNKIILSMLIEKGY